jgi:thiamine pyridinylase
MAIARKWLASRWQEGGIMWAIWRGLPFAVCIIVATLSLAFADINRRRLIVVLYPFIPEYQAVKDEVKKGFEASHLDVELEFIDLDQNYYAPGTQPQDEYIGATKANVYELDSVFLRDFVDQKKIQTWPNDVPLPAKELLKNAATGSEVNGIRYGVAHWVCGNFLFFNAQEPSFSKVRKLSDLENAIGSYHTIGQGLVADLKGKSTLGELYLETAFDHYGNWQAAKPHLQALDPILVADLERLVRLRDGGHCRSDQYYRHDPTIYARLFARRKARAFLGYSEDLHSVLAESAKCDANSACLKDSQIDVVGFPSDDNGRHQISWVDSFVLDAGCRGKCAQDAAAFVEYMSLDSTYRTILLHTGAAPAYLLPAKEALYNDAEILRRAHLYPKLKDLIESAQAPSDIGLNDELRTRGAELDSQLSGDISK